ncbi:S-layer homology domain-containing protein [Cohnella nanjingensis]|uniref:S-layer homology domain-containing protein n=1 Tax=Cohnella nanjingensis TaxID=1387779 RepID=A0A7X0VIP0_9BACL|nr:S-layer homology domain-containing protein [Cohnella nanjingensis]MBB6674753.1 S-layer homology domain-containing protein [Cohnella nanjingensis]
MSLKSRGKVWVGLIMILTLVWTGAGWPAPSASAAAKTPFSDVTAGHWAEKHIAKLALQGLVLGDKGKFNPTGVLSREDAVIIAIRFMGLEEEAKASGASAFPSTFYVDDYAKPYVNYAIKQKLLTSEQFALAEKETTVKWGKAPATREWISRLLVRAIGKEADAVASGGKATTFADNAAIDSTLLGYVNVAVAEGLVKGVDGNKFDPKASVNRATIATLFSRAESKVQVAYPGQASGMVLTVAPDKVSLLHSDGTTTAYAITDSTLFSNSDSESLTGAESLKLYGTAIVIGNSNGSAAYIEQTDNTAKAKTIQGKVIVVSTSKHEIKLLEGEEVNDYAYDAANLPSVTDAENNKIALADIPANSEVSLLVDTYRSAGKVLAVKLKQSAVTKNGQGTVTAVDLTSRTLQVKDAATGVTESRVVSGTATIQLSDGSYAKLDAVKVGDTVSYAIVNGSVTTLTVSKSATAGTIEGTLFKVDTAAQTVQYTTSANPNKITGLVYQTNVAVKVGGVKDATLADLLTGDPLVLTLDGEGKVATIEVASRSVQYANGSVISSYDNDAKVLVVKDAYGNPKVFTLGTNVRYDLNGTRITLEAAYPQLYKGKKVDIAYSGSNVVSLSFVARYSGTVYENNTSSRILRVQLDNGTIVNLPYVNPTVEIYGAGYKTYSDVAVGSKVTVLLNATQDQAATIQVTRTIQAEVTAVDAASGKLSIKRSEGYADEWVLGSGVSLKDEDNNNVTLSKYTSGTLINVTFQGNTPVAVKSVSVVFGRVTAIDTYGAALEVQSGAGTPVRIPVGANAAVVKTGTTYTSLATVQRDDRVEIRKDENDRNVITIIPSTRRFFGYADATTNTLYYKLDSSTQDSYVTLSPKLYLHKDTAIIPLSELRADDVITVYVLRGKAVEIVKQ